MFKRKFAALNADNSALGFGCMRLPLKGDAIDLAETERMFRYAIENGVNYFDTAYIYHGGESETAVGKILSKLPRESYYLADKMPGWCVENIADAERVFSDQLAKCRTEYFDFYLCHSLHEAAFEKYKEYLLEFLIQKKREGKIKRLGFSFHDTPRVLKDIVDYYDGFEFAQIQYNYLDDTQQGAAEQYKILTDKNIPVIIMEPLRGGLLATLSDGAAQVFKAAKPTASVASWALKYALNPSNVMCVLSGMSDFSQLEDNIKTAKEFKPLTDAELLTIAAAKREFLKDKTIPCTGCRYCMDCKFGVDIPLAFRSSNEHSLAKDAVWINDALDALRSANPQKCTACGVCAKHCPQKIDIPARMRELKFKAEK